MSCYDKIILDEISSPITEELQLFEREYHHQLSSDTDFLQPLLDYIRNSRGKRLRPILFFLSQGLMSRPNAESVKIAVLLELLHTATLIHDDVVDGSSERRGRKTMNAVWGNHISVLVGDYLLSKVLALGVKSGWEGILEVVSKVVMDMGKGELRQTLEGIGKRLTVDEYFLIIREKTAGLFMAACELAGLVMTASPGEKNRLHRLGETFGMAFQIRDDILDFSGYSERMGKPVGQDVSNGRATLPFIMALEGATEEETRRVLQRFERGTDDDGDWIREFVKKRGGIEKAQEKVRHFIDQAEKILASFEPSIYRESLERLMAHNLESLG